MIRTYDVMKPSSWPQRNIDLWEDLEKALGPEAPFSSCSCTVDFPGDFGWPERDEVAALVSTFKMLPLSTYGTVHV